MKSLYCMFDVVLGEASPPSVCRNDGEALRAFEEARKASKYPEDLRLFWLCHWDDSVPSVCHDTGSVDLHAIRAREVVPTVKEVRDAGHS